MGGKFYINSKNRPCFQLEGSVEEELKTSLFPGLKARVATRDQFQTLVSGEYLELGDLDTARSFTEINVPEGDTISVFAGEFSVVSENASISFPSSIRWCSLTPEHLELGKTYQYIIWNGLGSLREFSRRSGTFSLKSV